MTDQTGWRGSTGDEPWRFGADASAQSDSPGRPGSVQEIIRRAADAADGRRVSVREVVETLGAASFTPLLLLPAMLVVSPLSGIPGFSSVCGLAIALIAGQMVARRRHIWLPDWVLRRRLDAKRFREALAWHKRPARFADRVTRRRLTALSTDPMLRFGQFVCMVCGLAMPALELVPFTSSLLGATVSLFAIAFVTRDGVLVLFGFLAFVALAAVGYTAVSGVAAGLA